MRAGGRRRGSAYTAGMPGARHPAEEPQVAVQTRGPISPADETYARQKITQLRKFVHGPMLFARIDLALEANPAHEHPAGVKATIDVKGHVVRAHADASTIREAVDLVEMRLRHQLERLPRGA
jgi:ribosome-associated translation inhibitor RaiA